VEYWRKTLDNSSLIAINETKDVLKKTALVPIPIVSLSGCLTETQSALSDTSPADGIVESISGAQKIGDSVSIDRSELSVTEIGSLGRFSYNSMGVGGCSAVVGFTPVVNGGTLSLT
jgi:hypothetical protein